MRAATLSNAKSPNPQRHNVAATLDAGDEICTVLILSVDKAIKRLEPGQILAVKAIDSSAQLDLRAWCRMSGHGYLAMENHHDYAVYYLRKRGEPDG